MKMFEKAATGMAREARKAGDFESIRSILARVLLRLEEAQAANDAPPVAPEREKGRRAG